MFTNIFPYQVSGRHGSSFAQPKDDASQLGRKATARVKKAVSKGVVAGAVAGFTLAIAVSVAKERLEKRIRKAHHQGKGNRQTKLPGDTRVKRFKGEDNTIMKEDDAAEDDQGKVDVEEVMVNGEDAKELMVVDTSEDNIQSLKEEVVVVDAAQGEPQPMAVPHLPEGGGDDARLGPISADEEEKDATDTPKLVSGECPSCLKNAQKMEKQEKESNDDKATIEALTRENATLNAMVRARDKVVDDLCHSGAADRIAADRHAAHLANVNTKLGEDVTTISRAMEQQREDHEHELTFWKARAREAWNDKLIAEEDRDAALKKPKYRDVQKPTSPVIVVEAIEDTTFVNEVVKGEEKGAVVAIGQETEEPASMAIIPDASTTDATTSFEEPVLGDLPNSSPVSVDKALKSTTEGVVEDVVTDAEGSSKPRRHRFRHRKRANRENIAVPIPVDVNFPSPPQGPFRPSQVRPHRASLPPRFQTTRGAQPNQLPTPPYNNARRAITTCSRPPTGPFQVVQQGERRRGYSNILKSRETRDSSLTSLGRETAATLG